ncbi:hypothetical protein [uncultured Ruminococcus sp.]|uniref:hypothetical protein n=1 Tax=uncultured Ruminococcus sp. TaxID=165186 RepID=UPI0025CF51B1|nr:hypothetical protein [uncultured Ruminococcus sp.]
MKKLIFPAILLALLSGCGEVNGTTDNKDINAVTEAVDGATTNLQKYETESTTDVLSTSEITTAKSAGNKVSGTTTAVHTTSNLIVSATRASGNDGVVHGTTRSVPTVHRTTTAASTTSVAESPTQTTSYDPKDYSNISFSLGTKPNEIKVIRKSKNGEETAVQQLKDVDTTEIEKELKNDDEKKLDDFIISADFDDDSYPDIFIIENQNELNKSGKYYRYDPESGEYTLWKEMNALKNLVELKELEDGNISVFDRKDEFEYELKTYTWDNDSKLVLKSSIHQYPVENGTDDPDIYLEYVYYDAGGDEISRELKDISGNIIEDIPPVTTEPPTEPTEPATVNEEE